MQLFKEIQNVYLVKKMHVTVMFQSCVISLPISSFHTSLIICKSFGTFKSDEIYWAKM